MNGTETVVDKSVCQAETELKDAINTYEVDSRPDAYMMKLIK